MSQASVLRYTRSKKARSNDERTVNSFLRQTSRETRHLLLSTSACAGFHYLNIAGHLAPAFVHTVFECMDSGKEGMINEIAISTSNTAFHPALVAPSMDNFFVNIRPRRDMSGTGWTIGAARSLIVLIWKVRSGRIKALPTSQSMWGQLSLFLVLALILSLVTFLKKKCKKECLTVVEAWPNSGSRPFKKLRRMVQIFGRFSPPLEKMPLSL